jgi:hypothetical protein
VRPQEELHRAAQREATDVTPLVPPAVSCVCLGLLWLLSALLCSALLCSAVRAQGKTGGRGADGATNRQRAHRTDNTKHTHTQRRRNGKGGEDGG